jgi:hypothetical protein
MDAMSREVSLPFGTHRPSERRSDTIVLTGPAFLSHGARQVEADAKALDDFDALGNLFAYTRAIAERQMQLQPADDLRVVFPAMLVSPCMVVFM